MNTIPFGLKTGWWSIDLPHRPHPEKNVTYSLFSYEKLPPIVEKLDDDFKWLKLQWIKKYSLFESLYNEEGKLVLDQLTNIASKVEISLPVPFTTFMNSPDLQKRIRSCTDCYLDMADCITKTEGSNEGYLIHFLSDSQSILHWYIYVDYRGNHFVVTSPYRYGYEFEDNIDNANARNKIDMSEEDIYYCASSFTEFIYRFWLENEIWFALIVDGRRLTRTEKAYDGWYLGNT
jgi:hypothetical protein